MDNPDKHPDHGPAPVGPAPSLRQQAEDAFRRKTDLSPPGLQDPSPDAIRQTLHELQVHQIELEMQNEELRRAQVALDAARERYFDLYDLAPVGYCTLSVEGLILEANLAAATLLGVARGALIRQPLSRFMVREDQDSFYLLRKQLAATHDALSCELRMVRHDGTPIWAHLVGTVAHDAGHATVLRVVLTDVTERKRLTQSLVEQNVELERARQVADKANLAKSEFLSGMSHELRSPLNSILGFAQLMAAATPAPTPAQAARIDHILHAGWYLLALINDILDLASIESGKLSASLGNVSLPDVLRECEELIEPQAQQRGIHMRYAPCSGPGLVRGDPVRLKQVVVNLLANAVKYNRPGGTVEVTCSPAPAQRMRVSVRDTGEGLPPEKIAQLFQPFNRLGKETSAEEGTGIGLVVCKRLVELMGGEMGLESTVGVGSVFWFELKMAATTQAAPGATAGPAPTQAPDPADAASHTLLYIEDNPVNMELVGELIALRPGLRLLGAGFCAQGIELARIRQPEVILLDINLPDMNGFDALKILRDDPVTAHIPVLALSANAMPHDIEKGQAAGFFRYLTKPIKLPEFLAALDLALAWTESAAGKNPGRPG